MIDHYDAGQYVFQATGKEMLALPDMPISMHPIYLSLHDFADDWVFSVKHDTRRGASRPKITLRRPKAKNTVIAFIVPHCECFRCPPDFLRALNKSNYEIGSFDIRGVQRKTTEALTDCP